jgi:hypothetical protein
VINLRGSSFGRNRHILDQVIHRSIEPKLCGEIYKAFSGLPLDVWREQFDEACGEHKQKHPPELTGEGDQHIEI